MLCLLLAQMNDVRGFGPILGSGILVAFAVMTTLLPALLVLLGRWVFWPFVPRFGTAAKQRDRGVWHRLSALLARRPRLVWVATAVALAALVAGVSGLHIGQPADQAYTTEVGSVAGQKIIAGHFAGGSSAPAVVVASAAHGIEVVAAAQATPGVVSATASAPSPDGRWVRIEAVLADPPDSPAAEATLDRLRAATHAVAGGDALVGGPTATGVDTARAADRDNRVVLPVILLVVFAILILLLRALVAPLLLVASVVLSYAASMGAAALVFRAVGHPYIINALPLYAWLFLVTLGVDYTIFLMTRAREEVARHGHREGVLGALRVTGGVITSAGLVLAGTFAVLTLLPFVTALQMGTVVAVGVLLDTFVVRTLLVPALAVDVGPNLWWPSRQARTPLIPAARTAAPVPEISTADPGL
jgi:RND superfamily putative drug exporter